MEDVGGRRVVYDDDFTELPAQPAEVFDVVSSVEDAGLPEEAGAKHPPLVQQVGHGVGVLNTHPPPKKKRQNNQRVKKLPESRGGVKLEG